MENILPIDMADRSGIRIGAKGLSPFEHEIVTVLATRKGSIPLDRDFGISWDYIDLPLTEAMQHMVAEMGQQLEKYVPRIRSRT